MSKPMKIETKAKRNTPEEIERRAKAARRKKQAEESAEEA